MLKNPKIHYSYRYPLPDKWLSRKTDHLKMGLGCRIDLKLSGKLNLGINYHHTKNQVDQTTPTLREGGGRRGRGGIETRIVKRMQIISINGKT